MVLAMIRGAEQQTYSGQAHQSTQLLDAAERLAASGSSPKALSLGSGPASVAAGADRSP